MKLDNIIIGFLIGIAVGIPISLVIFQAAFPPVIVEKTSGRVRIIRDRKTNRIQEMEMGV